MKLVITLIFLPTAIYLLSAFRTPKGDAWDNENLSEEAISLCHGTIDSQSQKRHWEANVLPLSDMEFPSTIFIWYFMEILITLI